MELICEMACCGISCAKCGNFRKNKNCQGCHAEPVQLADCAVRACCTARGYRYCAECPELVCDRLRACYATLSDAQRDAPEKLAALRRALTAPTPGAPPDA